MHEGVKTFFKGVKADSALPALGIALGRCLGLALGSHWAIYPPEWHWAAALGSHWAVYPQESHWAA